MDRESSRATGNALRRRDVLRGAAAAGVAGVTGLAGCSGSLSGSTTTYGKWTPAAEGSGADDSGDSMTAMHPKTLDEHRHTLGDIYTAISTFLDPPVPTLAFGELDEAYVNAGWSSTLYGVEAEFEQSAMVSAYESEEEATNLDEAYEGHELLRVDSMAGDYLVGVGSGTIAIAASGENDRAALEALVDAQSGSARRVDGDGPFSDISAAMGDSPFASVSLGSGVNVAIKETRPTALGGTFSVTDGDEDRLKLRNGVVMPETVSDQKAAVEAHLEAEGRIGLFSYAEPTVTTESGVVLVSEERPVGEALEF